MPTTLTYSRKKPSDGDDSASWFDSLQDNIDINDTHNHDGSNSALLSASAISKESVVNISAGDWAGSAGSYTASISNANIPAAFKSTGTSSSELCTLVLMDSDSNDERVYLKYTWSGSGATASVTLTSTETLNLKVLFV